MAKKVKEMVEKALPAPMTFVPPTPKQDAISQMQSRREMAKWDRATVHLPIERERLNSGGLSDDPTESGEPVRNPKPFGKLSEG